MSFFNREELQKLLNDTYSEKLEETESKFSALKTTRKEFFNWLDDYSATLKEQIKIVEGLDPQSRDYRFLQGREDFNFFRRTYFPHYYTLEGESALQKDLSRTYQKIAELNKKFGLKFAKAAPRGFGKSTDASIVFPIWCIVYEIKHFITIFSDAIELTETMIEAIKAELEENDRLKQDFPKGTGEGDVWKVGEIVTTNNVKIKGFGSGKRVRGIKHGVYRPDLAIIDDLENDTNVRSRKQRDKTQEWLDEAIDNLGSVDGSMDTLYIGTILHRDSVLNRKLKLKFWHPKVFRSLISYPENMDLWEEYGKVYKHEGVEEAHNFYLENKEEMDAGARLLWDAVKLEFLMQKRAGNPKAFQKEQQNNPNSENQKFNSATFTKISRTEMPKLDRVFAYADAKGDSNTGDYFSFVAGGISYTTEKFYLFYSMRKRVKGKAAILETLKIIQTLGIKINVLGGDKNGGFYMFRDWLKSEALNRGITLPHMKFIHHTQNKEDRMGELEFPIDDGTFVFVGDHPELFQEMDDFPESDYDDTHDGASGVYSLSRMKKLIRGGNKRTNMRGGGKRYNRKRGTRR